MESLITYLASEDEKITVLRRPDREVRNERAVDFEIDLSGQLIGVEVTSASAHMANFVEAARFENRVEERISNFVEQRDLGQFAIRFSYQGRLRKSEVPRLISDLSSAIEVRLSRHAFSANLPMRIPVGEPLEEVEVFKLGNAKNSVGCISSPLPAYFVDEEVLAFIDDLVEKKKTQGLTYELLWILIHEGTPLFSPDDLAGGFRVSRDILPHNWARIYFVSSSGVQEVFSAV